jgi:lauroyl/myristoyl acyltransferase
LDSHTSSRGARSSTDPRSHSKGEADAFVAAGIRHRWPFWHAALRFLGVAIRTLPRSYRFLAAVFLAPLLVPIVRTTTMFGNRRRSVVETPKEIVLYSILNELARAGTEFEARVHVKGLELIEASIGSGKGVLLISARAMLGHAFVRYLVDQGYSVWLVSPDPRSLFGSKMPVPTLSPGLKYFLEIREHLRKGEIVIATPDRSRATPARTLSVETPEGTVHFATPLIEVALNAKAVVVFMRTWLKGAVVSVELSPSSLSGEPDANAIALQYADIIRHHVATRSSLDADGN